MAQHVILTYSELGEGTPVVLLHGFPLSADIWQDQQKSLSDHYRVITPDLRGHGQSPAPSGVYDMALLAGDVFALLDALNIDKAVIIGHSMGGYVALAGWRLAPERFLALGLVASQASADTEEGRQGRYKLAQKVEIEGSKAVADLMVAKLFAPGLSLDGSLASQVRQIILATPIEGIIGSLQGMAGRPDSTPNLPTINVPALVVAGNQDQIIPPAKAHAMAAALPRGDVAIIDNSGHMPMLEQPEATTNALRVFLKRHV